MQVIGLCRFSWPALGGFQVEHDSTAAREAFLYSPERMEERFRLFECVALPCLRNQTDPDFTLVVVIGDSLPGIWRARLGDLLTGMKQVEVVALPPLQHRPAMKDVLNAARIDPDQPCLQFRHDDDDAVAVDFVERLRRDAADCAGLTGRHPLVAFDYCSGHIAELGPEGIAAAEVFRPLNTAALAVCVAGGKGLSIMNFAHHKLPQFMPTVSFSDTPMFLRTHNAFNDSRQKKVKQVEVAPLSPDGERDLEARFAISAAHVRRVFG